jgi:hypothetical protein
MGAVPAAKDKVKIDAKVLPPGSIVEDDIRHNFSVASKGGWILETWTLGSAFRPMCETIPFSFRVSSKKYKGQRQELKAKVTIRLVNMTVVKEKEQEALFDATFKRKARGNEPITASGKGGLFTTAFANPDKGWEAECKVAARLENANYKGIVKVFLVDENIELETADLRFRITVGGTK